jgi:uncharacterized protein YbcV (DUF1398 family)
MGRMAGATEFQTFLTTAAHGVIFKYQTGVCDRIRSLFGHLAADPRPLLRLVTA